MELKQKIYVNTEELSKLEAQFILRLPGDVAAYIRRVLKKKPKKLKKWMKIDMNIETRLGQLTFNKFTVPLKLVDLPTIIESLKTIDKRVFFKTADIHQMYLAYEPEQNNNGAQDDSKQFLWPHGITPPLKNIRKHRFRKTMKNKQPLDGPEIEKEVKWLLKMDNEAISVRWELIDDEQYYQKNDNLNLSGCDSDGFEAIDEKEVFGDISDSISEDDFQELLQEFQDKNEDIENVDPYNTF